MGADINIACIPRLNPFKASKTALRSFCISNEWFIIVETVPSPYIFAQYILIHKAFPSAEGAVLFWFANSSQAITSARNVLSSEVLYA